jgi:hypothetical protein
MVIGIIRQPYGTILYRIKSSSREHLAPESELKLALGTERIGGIKSPEPLGGRFFTVETYFPPLPGRPYLPLRRISRSRGSACRICSLRTWSNITLHCRKGS